MFYLLNIASVVATSEMLGNAVGLEQAFIDWVTPVHDDSPIYPAMFFGAASLIGLTIAKLAGVSLWFDNLGLLEIPLAAGIATGWFYVFWWPTYDIITKIGGSPYVYRWITNLFTSVNAGVFASATVWLLSLISKL